MDGLCKWDEDDTNQDPAHPETNLRFHEATALSHELLESLQHTIRSRVLRHFRRHGLLEPHDAQDMLGWEHGGGFSLVGNCSDQILYLLPAPDLAGRTALRLSALEFLDRLAKILPPPRIHRHRYHGVFAPNAPLRPLVTAQAQEDNALAAQAPEPPLPLPLPTNPTVSLPTSEATPPQPPNSSRSGA